MDQTYVYYAIGAVIVIGILAALGKKKAEAVVKAELLKHKDTILGELGGDVAKAVDLVYGKIPASAKIFVTKAALTVLVQDLVKVAASAVEGS